MAPSIFASPQRRERRVHGNMGQADQIVRAPSQKEICWMLKVGA
jgi:hypothetical protein